MWSGASPHDGIGGDPSPATARTVLGAIRAAFGGSTAPTRSSGRSVGVIGLGKVGDSSPSGSLEAARACSASTRSPLPGPDGARRRRAGRDVEELLGRADGRARAVRGRRDDRRGRRGAAALRDRVRRSEQPALRRARRRVLERRDSVRAGLLANCGGLIHVDAERRGDPDPGHLRRALDDAATRTREVLVEARASSCLPGQVAIEHASRRSTHALIRAHIPARPSNRAIGSRP